MYYCYTASPFGDILLVANDDGLTKLSFQAGNAAETPENGWQLAPEKFQQVCQQLTEYFAGTRQQFNLKLAPQGTAFQQQVWQALQQISYGATASYQALAKAINNEKAVRAVGSANGKNPIALIIPCHRVIGANGKLTGYAGGLALKAQLLKHESAEFVEK